MNEYSNNRKLLARNIFFLVIFQFSFLCIGTITIINGQTKYPTLHVNLPVKVSGSCKASFFADKATYISLETKPDCLLDAMIRKIEINESVIAICDFKKLLLFNRQGKFLRQIGENGKGPGEFILIMDFILEGNELYITSTGKTAITKYAIDGKYLGEIPQKYRPTFICSLPMGGFVSYDRLQGSVIYYDNNWKIMDNLKIEYNVSPNRAYYMNGSTSDRFFFAEKGRILYTNYMNDTIWDITTKSKTPAFIFNLKEKLLPQNKQIEYYKGDFKRFNADAANYQKLDILPVNSFNILLQRPWNGKTNFLYLLNKNNQSIVKYENAGIFDDLTGNIQLYPSYSINNEIICIVDAEEILNEMQKKSQKVSTTEYDKFRKKMAKLSEEDNPVIVIIK